MTLIAASAEGVAVEFTAITAATSHRADAALFHFTHDILRSPAAVAYVMRALSPGAGVVACGLNWSTLWAWPVNLFVLGAALHSVSSLAGLARPWSLLADRLDRFKADSAAAGAVFVARGMVRASVPPVPGSALNFEV